MTEKPTPPPLPPGPRGRGAWPKRGEGGTLSVDGNAPGSYYMLAKEGSGMPLVGSGGWKSPDVNERAVHGAVLAIQRALNRRGKYGITTTGKYDQATFDTCVKFQREMRLADWGGIGSSTAKALLMPDLMSRCRSLRFKDWRVVCGVVQNESAWDPGAVGFIKPVDIGLAQINSSAHPDVTEQQQLRPNFSFTFIINYLTNAMKALDGNIDHAIASYNLGIGGAKRWIAAGCPDMWTPAGSVERDVAAYIERIKTSCAPATAKEPEPQP